MTHPKVLDIRRRYAINAQGSWYIRKRQDGAYQVVNELGDQICVTASEKNADLLIKQNYEIGALLAIIEELVEESPLAAQVKALEAEVSWNNHASNLVRELEEYYRARCLKEDKEK